MSRAKNKRKAAMARRKAGPVWRKGLAMSALEQLHVRRRLDEALYDIGFSIGQDSFARPLREISIGTKK